MPRAVFLDLVGTLIGAVQPIGQQYAGWARRHGADADPDRLDAAFRRAMRAAPAMPFPRLTGVAEVAAAERAWWQVLVRDVVRDCGLGEVLTGDRFDAFFADLYDHFTTGNAWFVYPDVQPALSRLRRQGLVVGLITNYDTRVYSLLQALGLAGLLDSVTIPAIAGAAKPAAAIFRHALDLHHLEANEAIYVGDEVGDDCEGAAGAGMEPVLIDREARLAGTGRRTITSLDELRLQGPAA